MGSFVLTSVIPWVKRGAMNDAGIWLSDQERERFAAYLMQDVESNRMIVQQLEKLPYGAPIVESKKREMAACLIVARMLTSGETQTIR